jgi:hypothetical protein
MNARTEHEMHAGNFRQRQRLTVRFAISQRVPYSQRKLDYLAQRCRD